MDTKHLSKRAQSMSVSPIRNLVPPKNKNVHVHKLNIGQPDIESPKEFLQGVRQFSSYVIAYDSAKGNKNLLQEWTKKFNQNYALDLTENEMLITSGSSEALTFAFNICCDVDDEILVFAPTYANYTGFAIMSGVRLIPIPCRFDTNFHIPIHTQEIEQHITSKTKAILICDPNNPTGTTFTEAELLNLLSICTSHNMFLIVDEVYREFVYDGIKPKSILQLAPKHESVVVVDSISKRYSLCGARIGCLVAHNQAFMQAATNFASTRVSAPTIEQEAAAYMLKHISASYLQNAIDEYEQRRNVLVSLLQNIPGVKVRAPEGGFYVLAELPVADSKAFAHFMEYEFSLNNETVSIAPANGFFIGSTVPTSYVRIAFVLSIPHLRQSVKILEEALKSYAINGC